MFSKNKKSGFTLAELLVVITLFSIVILSVSSIYSRFVSGERRLKVENELLEETRFTLERIVKEFREGTLDYEEYWNQANSGDCTLYNSGANATQEYGIYGNCYKDYTAQFYDEDNIFVKNKLNHGQNPYNATNIAGQQSVNAVSISGEKNYKQDELYIINNSGNKRTLLRLQNGRLQVLRLNGFDLGYKDASNNIIDATSNDGIIDTWLCAKDFTCTGVLSDGTSTAPSVSDNDNGWIDYSPITLNLTNLDFYISPLEDPRKAYNEDQIETQVQPHVTIMLTAQMSDEKYKGIPGKNPSITLQTTVSARVFNEVK